MRDSANEVIEVIEVTEVTARNERKAGGRETVGSEVISPLGDVDRAAEYGLLK